MDSTDTLNSKPRIALVWRGDAAQRAKARADNNRLAPVFEALAAAGAAPEPAVFADELVAEVSAQLLGCDGVLVWVDPISGGQDRGRLDALLGEVAAVGVWVSAHPDVILRMGAKSVLYETRDFGWGGDTHLYRTPQALAAEFPGRLAAEGRRVLKQNRGNGGIGVWKVEMLDAGAADPAIRIHHQHGDLEPRETTMSAFLQLCAPYFAGGGMVIDQPFFARVFEGMVRCYMSEGTLVGFSEHWPRGSAPESADAPAPVSVRGVPLSAEKLMYGPDEPALQGLRAAMERDWTPALQRRLGIAEAELPALWDADFVRGQMDRAGEDGFVLCEINVSAVFPFPPTAPVLVAEAAVRRTLAAKAARTAI